MSRFRRDVPCQRLVEQVTEIGDDREARARLWFWRTWTIIGVAPAAFRGVFTPLKIDAWVPLAAQPHAITCP